VRQRLQGVVQIDAWQRRGEAAVLLTDAFRIYHSRGEP